MILSARSASTRGRCTLPTTILGLLLALSVQAQALVAQLLILPGSDVRAHLLPLRGPVRTITQSDSVAGPRAAGKKEWQMSLMAELDRSGRLVSWSSDACTPWPCHRPSVSLDGEGRVATEEGWSDPVQMLLQGAYQSGNVRFERRYTYGPHGLPAQVLERREWLPRPSGEPLKLPDAIELYTYDDKGRLTDARLMRSPDTITIAIRYDSAGGYRQSTRAMRHDGPIVWWGSERSVDRNGHLVSRTDIYDGEERTITSYINDSLGNPLTISGNDLGRRTGTTHEYRYDRQGNWIERRTYETTGAPASAGSKSAAAGRRLTMISRRTISYYTDAPQYVPAGRPVVY